VGAHSVDAGPLCHEKEDPLPTGGGVQQRCPLRVAEMNRVWALRKKVTHHVHLTLSTCVKDCLMVFAVASCVKIEGRHGARSVAWNIHING
jgi:hypothetical protein